MEDWENAKRVVLVVSSALQEKLREGRKSCQWASWENLRGNGQCESPPFPTVLRILLCLNRTKQRDNRSPATVHYWLTGISGSLPYAPPGQTKFKLDHSVGIRRDRIPTLPKDSSIPFTPVQCITLCRPPINDCEKAD